MVKKRILLADADSQALEEFRQALGQQWELTGVDSGAAALAEMKERPYDVLAASLDLPEIDGAELLKRIRKKYPKTVRFILAPEADKDRVMKKVLGAHQFLTKPMDPATLRTTLERTLALDVWMTNQRIRELVARVRTFPAIPSLYVEVLAALRSPNATTQEVGAIIAKDMAMMTKLLQVLNSAYFSLSRKITDPAEAVGLLGFETVKSMVVAIKLLTHYDRVKPVYFSIDRLWRHSTEVARIARELALSETGDRVMADTAFTAGLLHDVGKVFLAANFDEQYRGVQSLARKQPVSLWEAEKEVFGASHGEIGAYLLALWGMPLDLLEGAAFHHHPSRSIQEGFTPLTAVHVANVLEYEANPNKEDSVPPKIDEAYLAEIGLVDRLNPWRRTAGLESLSQAESCSTPAEHVVPQTVALPPPTRDSPPTRWGEALRKDPALFPQGLRRHMKAAAALLLVLTASLGTYLLLRSPESHRRPPADAGQSTFTHETPASGAPDHAAAGFLSNVPHTNVPETAIVPAVSRPDEPSGPMTSAGGAPEEAVAPSSGQPLAQAPAFPEVRLQGIYFSQERPMALIDGQMVHVNDLVAGAIVVEIRPSAVVLGFANQRKTLSLK